MSEPGLTTELLGKIIYQFSLIAPFLPTYLHLITSALFPIYTGAHASLSRPLSAAKPVKKKRKRRDGGATESSHKMEGLSPSDALLYPIMTGCMLAGLYVLIKWLNDPEILNTILNWYLSIFGIFSISKLLSDCLTTANSFIFPSEYYDQGLIWEINDRSDVFEPTPTGSLTLARAPSSRESPLPGALSRLPLPNGVRKLLWRIRGFPTKPIFVLNLNVRRIVEGSVEVDPQTLLCLAIAVTSVAYFNLIARPWWLTNLLGFSFSYSALQMMSPTTFWTGTLLLTALFFYDIYFVFFTPMMITVATKLDIPVKLLFPRPHEEGDDAKKALAMLGLGDIVLPGIMIGLALRFDLYAFYLKMQKRKEPVGGRGETSSPNNSTLAIKSMDELQFGPLVYGRDEIGKAEYKQATGNWGERFWLGSERQTHEGSNFPKTYFYASVTGYILGMLTTVSIMHIFKHGQPALLYLVPGVLLSLWGTALYKGELKMMWKYTELDEEEENKEEVKEKAKGAKTQGKKGEAQDAPSAETPKIVDTDPNSASEKPKVSKSFFSFYIARPTGAHKGLKLGDALEKDLKRVSRGPVGALDEGSLDQYSESDEITGSPSNGEFVESRKKPDDGPGMKRRRIA